MTAASTILRPGIALTAGRLRAEDGELNRFYCCDENLALCGTDLTTWTVDEDCEIDCAVCLELAEVDLPCGAPGCPEGGAA